MAICLFLGGRADAVVPVAHDDFYETWMETPLRIPAPGVLANDEGDDLTCVFIDWPPNGSLDEPGFDGSFIYTPWPGFSGVDTMTYVATNIHGRSETGTVHVTVHPPEYLGVLVVLIRHPENTNTLTTIEDVESVMEQVNNAYLEISYNRVGFTGVMNPGKAADVVGWYEWDDADPFVCWLHGMWPPNSVNWLELAADDVDDLTAYSHVAFLYANTSAGFEACASMSRLYVTTSQGEVQAGWSVYRGSNPGVPWHLYAHEIGHNHRLGHSYVMDCGDETLKEEGCPSGGIDPFCFMGWDRGHLNAYHKHRLGWLDGPNQIVSLTTGGVYRITLEPLQSNSGGIKAIRLPRYGGDMFIQYRRHIGVDQHYSATNDVFQGASFHVPPYLLNMNPPADSGGPLEHRIRPTLKPGEMFEDPLTGHRYTVIETNTVGLVIEIEHSGYELDPPELEFVSPLPGEIVSGIFTVEVHAVDNTAVDRVEFRALYDNGETLVFIPLGTSTVAVADIYSVEVASENFLWNGSYTFRADVYDVFNNHARGERPAIVHNVPVSSPPTIAIVDPYSGYTNSTEIMNVSAEVVFDENIYKVDFVLNGGVYTPHATVWPEYGEQQHFMLINHAFPRGRNTLKARVHDYYGRYGDSESIEITIVDETDETPPWGFFVTPTENQTVYGITPVEFIAGDNEGVAEVILVVFGHEIHTNTASSFTFMWDTMAHDEGNMLLQATIRDIHDNTMDAGRNVIINQDEDGDGIPSWWEALHFGGPTNAVAHADPDGDGFTNWQEYIADTDPTNALSFFHAHTPVRGEHPTLHFESSSNRVYTLRGLNNLLHGTWNNVPGAGPRPGVGGPDSLQDTNEPPLGPYYRLKVELP